MKVTIIQAPSEPFILVGTAAGICYGKDAAKEEPEKTKKRAIRCYKQGHESVWEHAVVTFKVEGISRACSHQLVRHRLASYCVAGDTELRSLGQKRWSVEDLYMWQSDPKRKSRLGLMNIRSVDESTNTVVPNHIERITMVGEKQVYELTTESGRTIKCTSDHKIYTPDGYKELGELNEGDYVYANGLELLENKDWLQRYYIEENHTRKETAEFIGCCESLVNRACHKFGIKKPHSAYPNRKGGHGRKGMFSKESIKRMSEQHMGDKNPSYINNRSKLTVRGGYDEAHRKFKAEKCELCGSTERMEIHHIDRNPRNNDESNIMFLCSKCHHLWHHVGAIGVFKDKVVSISKLGVEPVYDVTMAAPHHNFVANGIVVHNCQESQRYTNYSGLLGHDLTEWCVIPPSLKGRNLTRFTVHAAASLAQYCAMVEEGAKPEDARFILPEGTKTNLVVTMNMRQLFHVFTMRLDKHAQWEIRELSQLVMEALSETNEELKEVMQMYIEKRGA